MQPSMGYQVIPRDPLDFPPEDAHVYPPSTSKIHDRIIYILTHEKVRSKVVATLGATRAVRYSTGDRESMRTDLRKPNQDTAAIAQNAFPALREYAPEQIGFYLGDARILDVAWPHLFAHPPAEVNISVIHRTSDPGIGRVDMGTGGLTSAAAVRPR